MTQYKTTDLNSPVPECYRWFKRAAVRNPSKASNNTWTDTGLTCSAGTLGRRAHPFYFCDSALLLEQNQTHSSRPLNLSASSLLSQETPEYQLLLLYPPYTKDSNWLPGSDQANNALWGFLLEERPFWSHLKKYPDLVLSCQELYSPSPTNLLWPKHCLIVSG